MDWVYIYYLATVLLKMTEKELWKCTLRKLIALRDMHMEINNSGSQSNDEDEWNGAERSYW